jgi:hypothetical protein
MIPSTLVDHCILLESQTLNAQLLIQNQNGVPSQPFTEFIKEFELPETGTVRLFQVGFTDPDPGNTDLSQSFSLLSVHAIQNRAWEQNYYLPYISVGILDMDGNTYGDHLIPPISAALLNSVDNPASRANHPGFTLKTLVTQTVNDYLVTLIDVDDPVKRELQVPAFDPQTCKLAIHLAGFYVLVGHEQVFPMFFIQTYVVILNQKLKSVLHVNRLNALADSADVEDQVKKHALTPITAAAYKELFANPDTASAKTLPDLMSMLIYGSMRDEWAKMLLKSTLSQTPTEHLPATT